MLALLASGCGGKSSYSLEKTRACLRKQKGVRLHPVPASNLVASVAEGGAVVVVLPSRNQVTVAFGQDGAEAKRIEQGYRRFRGRNIGIEDVLRPDRNAVLLWRAHPSEKDIAAVKDCLK